MHQAFDELDMEAYEKIVAQEMQMQKVNKFYVFICMGGVAFGTYLVL